MTGQPAGTKIWLAAGMNGLAAKAQTTLAADPCSGRVFLFRSLRRDIIKVQWWSGDDLCLLAKHLERSRFVRAQADSGGIALTQAHPPNPAYIP